MERARNWFYNLLRRSESVFKTDMVYLAKGGLWLTLLQFFTSLASFLLAIGFAHFLSAETYGTYKYILSVGGIITAFSLTGLGTAIIKAAARGQDYALITSFKKNLKWSLLTFIIFVATSVYYYLQGNHTLAEGLLLIGIVTPLFTSASLADSYIQGKKDFRRVFYTSTVYIFFVNGLTLLAAFLTNNVLILIGTYMVASLIAKLWVYFYSLRVFSPQKHPDDPGAVAYGAHLSFMGILNTIVDKLDSVLAFHYLGAVDLAVYSFAIAMPEQIKGLVKNSSALAMPKLSENGSDEQRRSLFHKMWIMTLVMIPVIIIYVLAAPLLFKIFFPRYLGQAVLLSQIYMISLITAAAILPTTYLQAKAAKKELYLFNVIGGIFQIVAMTIGAMSFGLMGLIISITISRIFRMGYASLLINKSSLV